MRRLVSWLMAALCVGASVVLPIAGCASPSDDDDEVTTGELHEDPVTTPTRTVWWPLQQAHASGHVAFLTDGQAWTCSRGDNAGVAAKTAPRVVAPGPAAFLVQVAWDRGARGPIGEIRVVADGAVIARQPVVARDLTAADDDTWQRQAISFSLRQSAHVSFELEWNRATGTSSGVVTLARPGRPFWHIGHNPNALYEVDDVLAAGANAIEPDLQFENGDLIVREVGNELTNRFTGGDVKTEFDDYVTGLLARPSITLVMWDLKVPKTISAKQFGELFYRRLGGRIPFEKQVLSLTSTEMGPFFDAMPAGARYGRDVSQIRPTALFSDPMLWPNTATAFHLSFLGMGISQKIPLPLTEWLGPMGAVVNQRDRVGDLKKSYYWTAGTKSAMRRMLDLGVDGLIVDDDEDLEEVLHEAPYATLYRKATAADSQFTVHGFPLGPAE